MRFLLYYALKKHCSGKANRTRLCLLLAIALQTILTVFIAHSHQQGSVIWTANSTTVTASSDNKNSHQQPHHAAVDNVRIPSTMAVVVDIMSIGSIHRPQLQDAQEATFGSHAAIRRFVRITEHDDVSDPACHSHLTVSDVKRVSQFCRRLRVSLTLKHKQQEQPPLLQQSDTEDWHPSNETSTTIDEHDEHVLDNQQPSSYFHLKRMTAHYATFKWLSKKANPTGWMCAQKRPIDGLAKILSSYQSQQQQQQVQSSSSESQVVDDLPDYLIVMDDDTWMNLDFVLAELREHYPSSSSALSPPPLPQALAVAGCRIRSVVRVHNFTIPFGGWGLILNRAALQNLRRPITCHRSTSRTEDESDNNNGDFVRNACRRIAQDNIGEGRLFTNGMSVLNLMQAYAQAESYLQQQPPPPLQQQQQTSPTNSSSHNTTTHHHSPTAAWVQSLHDVHAPPRFGYCLHSDWAWGYWINFYNIAIHSTEPIITTTTRPASPTGGVVAATTAVGNEAEAVAAAATAATSSVVALPSSSSVFDNVPEDRLRAYQDTSTMQAGERTRYGQCVHNGNEQCSLQAHICHYVNETHMQALHRQQQQQHVPQEQRQ